VFGNRVLRGIFGPKRDEVTGGCGMWKAWTLRETCTKSFFGENAEGKRPLERARRRWENMIGVDLRDMIWKVWPVFRIWGGDVLLWSRCWTSGFCRHAISYLVNNRQQSQLQPNTTWVHYKI
jgi:hypothetical protein